MTIQTVKLAPGLRCLRAPNPSPMTGPGTNTYILGECSLAVIDPGPDQAEHLENILQTIGHGPVVSHIIVTHTHNDHSPLAKPLSDATGAPILAFGSYEDGRSETMRSLARQGRVGGGEGIDRNFSPNRRLRDGEVISSAEWELEVLHTPGHTSNHICLAWNQSLFTGDHVLGWTSTLISPPDGDLTAFMKSCERLRQRKDDVFYPGHGDPVQDPGGRLKWLISHREQRAMQIRECLQNRPKTVTEITREIYVDLDENLIPAAERNVLAHLIDLVGRSQAFVADGITLDAEFFTI